MKKTLKERIDNLWELAEEAKKNESFTAKQQRQLALLQRDLKKLDLGQVEPEAVAEVSDQEVREEIENMLFDNESDENN